MHSVLVRGNGFFKYKQSAYESNFFYAANAIKTIHYMKAFERLILGKDLLRPLREENNHYRELCNNELGSMLCIDSGQIISHSEI